MSRVQINTALLSWARERAGLTQEELIAKHKDKFKKLPEWESGATKPTLKQIEGFARAVNVSVGYLFLSQPPKELIPIPDFRTFTGQAVKRPSPNLLDTIYACQDRQAWYRGYAQSILQPELEFVSSAMLDARPEVVAARMRRTLGFGLADQQASQTWRNALRLFIRKAGEAGILVMVSGVVGSNNHRVLDPEEFRGFALSDPLAPLVFINGADTKAAQIFTLAHELAHIWLGSSALSNLEAMPGPATLREEVWCNAVAAEFLVPMEALRTGLQEGEPLPDALSRLARIFKVSTLVILRRLLDANWLARDAFDLAWQEEVEHLRGLMQDKGSGGGDFYSTTLARVSRRFASALVVSTLEGHTSYSDAFRMLGISRTETLNKIGREVGVIE